MVNPTPYSTVDLCRFPLLVLRLKERKEKGSEVKGDGTEEGSEQEMEIDGDVGGGERGR